MALRNLQICRLTGVLTDHLRALTGLLRTRFVDEASSLCHLRFTYGHLRLSWKTHARKDLHQDSLTGVTYGCLRERVGDQELLCALFEAGAWTLKMAAA